MTDTTTETDRTTLRAEAERRVRAGEERNAVARALGVHPSTLRDWALAGGWRRRDLASDPAVNREAALAQAEKRRAELDRLDKTTARARELVEKVHIARERIPHEGAPPPPATDASPQEFALAYAQALLEDGRIDEADRTARFAMRYAQAAAAIDKLVEPQWRRQQKAYRKWLEDFRPDILRNDELIDVSLQLQDEIGRIKSHERERMATGCCHTCGTPIGEDEDDYADAPEMETERDHASPDPAPASVIESAIDDEEPAATDPPRSEDASAPTHPAPASLIDNEPPSPEALLQAERRRAFGMNVSHPAPASEKTQVHVEPG